MKKALILILVFLLICTVGCGAASGGETSGKGSDSTTAPTLKDEPSVDYAYGLDQIGGESLKSGEIEGSFSHFEPSIPEACKDLYFQESASGSQRITEFEFIDGTYDMIYFRSRVSYPSFPAEYGAYSIHNTAPGSGGVGTVYIREKTGTPIYILREVFEPMFDGLNLNNRDATVDFVKSQLEKYTDLSGYTVSVYEDETLMMVNGRYVPGISVEYNLTVNGIKTNCYARMSITSNKDAYCIELCNEIEDSIKPYLQAKVSMERIESIVKAETEKACESSIYRYDSYKSEIRLMVIDGKLKAYATVHPRVLEMDSDKEIYTPIIRMLIDVATLKEA